MTATRTKDFISILQIGDCREVEHEYRTPQKGKISILFAKRHTTAKKLAEEFHVSICTIRCDMQALSLGYPIYTKLGESGEIIDRVIITGRTEATDSSCKSIIVDYNND